MSQGQVQRGQEILGKDPASEVGAVENKMVQEALNQLVIEDKGVIEASR